MQSPLSVPRPRRRRVLQRRRDSSRDIVIQTILRRRDEAAESSAHSCLGARLLSFSGSFVGFQAPLDLSNGILRGLHTAQVTSHTSEGDL